jgi:hypothetical protein
LQGLQPKGATRIGAALAIIQILRILEPDLTAHYCFRSLVHHDYFKAPAMPFLLWGWIDIDVLSLPGYAAVRAWKGGEKVF